MGLGNSQTSQAKGPLVLSCRCRCVLLICVASQRVRGSASFLRCQKTDTAKHRTSSSGPAVTRLKPGANASTTRAGRVTSAPEVATAASAGGNAGRPRMIRRVRPARPPPRPQSGLPAQVRSLWVPSLGGGEEPARRQRCRATASTPDGWRIGSGRTRMRPQLPCGAGRARETPREGSDQAA